MMLIFMHYAYSHHFNFHQNQSTSITIEPCAQLSPIIDQFAEKYPQMKVLKVDYDQFDDIIDNEAIEKLPTLKTFHNGQAITTTVGTNMQKINEQVDELLKLGGVATQSTTAASVAVSEAKTTSPHAPVITKSVQAPAFAHPADAAKGMENVPIGSNRIPTLKPVPAELTQFQSTLATYSVVLFTHASQVNQVNATGASYGKAVNVVNQCVDDLQMLTNQYTNNKQPIMFKHVIVTDNDQASQILAEEYGATNLRQLPIIKLLYKKICFATFYQGDTLEVEKALLDFVQL